MANEDIREIVKQKYGQAAKAVAGGAKPSCCGAGSSCGPSPDVSAIEGTDPSRARSTRNRVTELITREGW
jgi:hypothetical protein